MISANYHRRQLTPSQRAMVADKARELFDTRAKERMKARKGKQPGASRANCPDLSKGRSRDAAGAAVGVGGSLVDRARMVRTKGVPELAKAVEDGRMSVTAAADAPFVN